MACPNAHFRVCILFWSWLCLRLCRPTESLPSLYELCPYTTFCQGGPLISDYEFAEAGKMPCCLPCSCHDECDRIGNCCPDKEPTPKKRIGRQYPCKSLKSYQNNFLNVFSKTEGELSLRIIDSCPYEFIQGNESDSRCYGDATIGDLYFVTDVKSNITYVNERCALCNGVKDVIKWDLIIACADIFNYRPTSFANRDNAVLNNSCRFYALPPSQDIGLLSICSGRKNIDECNVTGMIKHVDPIMEHKCRNSNPLQVIDVYPVMAYINPYCMLCNEPISFRSSVDCKAIEFDFSFNRFSVYPFSVLINGDSLVLYGNTDVTGTICDKSQVLDPSSMTCIDLECPPLTYPERGLCRKMFDEVNGYGIDLHYTISGNSTSQQSVSVHERAYEIKEFLQEKMQEVGLECDICRITADENGRSAIITISSKRFCEHISLLNFIGSNGWQSDLDFDGSYGLKFKLALTGSVSINLYHIVYRKYVCQTFSVFDENTTYCPSVSLEMAYLQKYDIGTNKEWLSSILNSSNVLQDGRLRVCLEEYEAISHLYNSVSVPNGFMPYIIVLAFLISILRLSHCNPPF